MAYVVRTASDYVGNSPVATIDLPASLEDDLIVLAPQTDGGSALSTIAGNNGGTWTQQANQNGGDEIWVFTCVQGATPDTQVTVTWTGNKRTSYTVAVVRGADTTTPVDVVATSNGSSKAPTAPSVTTTTDDCLVMFLVSTGTGENTFPFEGAYVPQQYKESYRSNTLMAYTYQQPSGATGTYDFYNCSSSGRNSAMVTLAIRDDGNGDVKGYHDSSDRAFEFLHMMCENGGIFSDGTQYDPSDVANENISSLSNGSYTNSSTGTHNSTSTTLNSLAPGYASRFVSSTSGALNGDCLLRGFPITETDGVQDNHDLSGELLIVNAKMTAASAKKESQIGVAFGLSDKTNVRFWQLSTPDSIPAINSGLFPSIVDVDDSSFVMDEVGTPDTTDIGGLIFCSEPTSTFNPLSLAPVSIMRTLKLQGGSVNFPCSFTTAYDIARDGLLNTVLAQGGLANNQYLVAHHTQCGGSETVHWDSSNQAIEWPAEYSAEDSKRSFKIAASKLTHTVAPITGSTVIYDSCTLNFGNYHNFVLNSPNVNISSTGLTVLNANVTLTAHSGVLSGVTFSGCRELSGIIDMTGGNTISSCVDAQAVTVTSDEDFENLANCTFSDNSGNAILITGDQSGSWPDPNLTVSGNTYDIEYTGTTDFEIQSATTLTVNNSSTGTLTIATPVQAFQIDSSETGSLIQIFATGTQTVLDSTTGSSLTYPYTGTVVVDYLIQKAGFLPQRFTGITLTNSTASVVLADDPVYDSGHGLTYTTDFSYNRGTKELTLATRQEGRDFYSALVDAFIAQTTLRNTAFNFKAVGPDSIFFLDDAEIVDSSSEDNWKGAGIRYLTSSDVVSAEWCSVKSAGTIPTGATGKYQQVDGSSTTDLRATGAVNQIIKVYGDSTHGNFDYRGHLVVKYQVNGYREVRANVLDLAGVSTLEPFEYSIAMEPVALTVASGDPAISGITITDHGASPVTWNGKQFSVTITDSGANSGDLLLRELNYNLSLGTTYQGKDPFNWGEMVVAAGSAYESIQGELEGDVGATLKGVRVMRGTDPHPDFTRFQADDGTYYAVPVTASGSISGIVSGSRLRIYNETKATETYNDVPGTSYSVNYTEGTTYSSGDVIKIYVTQTSGTTAQLPFSTTTVASGTGWTALVEQESDDVYDGYGLDGSSYTGKFSADYTNDEVDVIVASNFAMKEMYAWWCHNLTTSQGISDFYGGITAQDAANIRINNSVLSMYLDNTTTTNIYQTDNIRIYRTDEAYPVKNPTSGGGGIDVVWRDRVYIAETGVSGLTASESTQLFAASTFNPAVDVVEGSETWQESMRLVRAEAAGKVAVSGDTVTFRDAADSTDRIVATVDEQGQRTAITTDVS